MSAQWILTVLGPDRPGLVEALAETVRDQGGSWKESRMMQLQGQFAGIVDVSIPPENRESFLAAAAALESSCGLRVHAAPGRESSPSGEPLRFECVGQDRPGIVLAITDVFQSMGVNVETMETEVESAPMSGETLFKARFEVRVPASVRLDELQDRLSHIGEELMLDVEVGA